MPYCVTFDDRDATVLEEDICPCDCRALWCAVIEEQLALAVSPYNIDHACEIDSARRWFGSRDFFMVCALAGLDGALVLSGVRCTFRKAGVQ